MPSFGVSLEKLHAELQPVLLHVSTLMQWSPARSLIAEGYSIVCPGIEKLDSSFTSSTGATPFRIDTAMKNGSRTRYAVIVLY